MEGDCFQDDFVAPACHDEINILFQDEHLLLIVKPSGLLSLSGKSPLNKDSVHYRLVREFPSATMVHRLDFGTSGLMIVALNKKVSAHLSKQFEARTVIKYYEAILDGILSVSEDENMKGKTIGSNIFGGKINLPIAKDSFPRLKICKKTGKNSLSFYRVLNQDIDRKTTRVKFLPETGRTHQLRIHSQAIGHPILGCDLYGSPRTHNAATRLLLHATGLEFEHPYTGKQIKIDSPCPF
ncbi:MAG: RluA family pseudouridine synthase [Cellvibrionaceae bacterium]